MSEETMDAENVEQHLESICRSIIDKKKWKPFNDISVEVDDFPAVVGAHITLQDWKIKIMASPELYPAVERLRTDEKLDIFFKENDQEAANNQIIEKIMYALVVHEYGHYRWCPSTQEGLQRILSGVHDAIHKREYKKERIERICFELHNQISDVILNTLNARTDPQKEKYREGLDLTYLLMANHAKRKYKQRGSKDFELFLHANLLLSDTHPQMFEKIKKYGPWLFFGKERYRRKVIDAFTQNKELTEAVLEHQVTPEQSQYIVERFKNVANWYQISRDYAEIVHPFLDEPNPWLENSYSRKNSGNSSRKNSGSNKGSANPAKEEKNEEENNNGGKNDGDKNSKNSGKENNNDSEDTPSGNNDGKNDKGDSRGGQGRSKDGKKDGNTEGKKSGRKDHKKDGEYQDGSSDAGDENNDNEKTRPDSLRDFFDQLARAIDRKPYSSPFLEYYPRLNQLYDHRAGRIILTAEEENRSGMFHELYAGKEPLALDDFSMRRLAWSETRMYEGKDGLELELFRRSMPLRLDIESMVNPGGLPDICWIIDSSASMAFNPLEGEGRGDYHYGVLGVYSILNYLKEINLAYELRYDLINFSLTTVSSGWRSYSEIEEVKRTLFDYQGSWTNLDPKELRKMRETRQDSVICFMLSDTMFAMDNEQEIIHEVDQMLATGDMGFYLFQMGGPTTFCRALEDRGIPPTYITSARDFMNLSIHFTKNLYGRETSA